jgi:hypothetical protein
MLPVVGGSNMRLTRRSRKPSVLVKDLIEQTKQVIAKTPPSPGQ